MQENNITKKRKNNRITCRTGVTFRNGATPQSLCLSAFQEKGSRIAGLFLFSIWKERLPRVVPMAAKGRADGCQGGKEKHPWVKGMPSKGRADISYGGIGMPPTIHRRYRNTPITGIRVSDRRHSFVFGFFHFFRIFIRPLSLPKI